MKRNLIFLSMLLGILLTGVLGANVFAAQVPAPTQPTLTDIGDKQNAADISVTFNGASDETNIDSYRVIIVRSGTTLTAGAAAAVTYYSTVVPSGNNAAHTVTLSGSLKDTTGVLIANGIAYKAYVYAHATGGDTDNISTISALFTLTSPAPKADRPVVADVANNGNGSDLSITFREPVNMTTIQAYQVYAVLIPPAPAPEPTFTITDAATADGLGTFFVSVTPTGGRALHTVTTLAKDSAGNNITSAGSAKYKIYVMSVGKTGYTNSMSSPSPLIGVGGTGVSVVLGKPGAPKLTDAANAGNSGDFKINIKAIPFEENLVEYRVFLVLDTDATFDLAAAKAVVDSTRYYSRGKLGSRKSLTVSLGSLTKDYSGAALDYTKAYKAYVLAVPSDINNSNISDVSNSVTLDPYYPSVARVTTLQVADISDNNNASDIQVKFRGLVRESTIQRYKVFVVASTDLAGFDLAAASSNTYFTEVTPAGSRSWYTVNLDAAMVDSGNGVINKTKTFKVFVLAEGTGVYANSLSTGSADITLAP